MRCPSTSSLDNQFFDGTPGLPSGSTSPVPPLGRTRSNTASLVTLPTVAMAPLRPTSISIDTSGINFHKARTEARESPFEAASPFANNSTPSARSLATINDSRPSSTRSFSSKSPVSESLASDWASKMTLSSANKSEAVESANSHVSQRKTRVLPYSGNLSRIDSGESDASAEDAKDKALNGRKGLVPDKTGSFTFFTEEYGTSKGEVVDGDRQSPFSDTSTVLDESFSEAEGDDLLMSPTRKNSAFVTTDGRAVRCPAREAIAILEEKSACSNRAVSPKTHTLTATDSFHLMDTQSTSDGPTGSSSFTSSLLSSLVDREGGSVPAFDRPPTHPKNVHFSGNNTTNNTSAPDSMENCFDSSHIKKKKDELGSLRRAITEPLPNNPVRSNALLSHNVDSPQLSSASSCPTSHHAPTESNLYTPQTKVCCETPWLQSAGADQVVLDFLKKKFELICSTGIKSIAEVAEGEHDSPITNPPLGTVPLHRAQSVSAVFPDGHTSRLSSVSNRESDAGFARYVQEDGGRLSMASGDSHRLSHANSDPPPMEIDPFDGSYVVVNRPRASTAFGQYGSHHHAFGTPEKVPPIPVKGECIATFLSGLSQKAPGSLSMSSGLGGRSLSTNTVFDTTGNMQNLHSFTNTHITNMQSASTDLPLPEIAGKNGSQRLRSKQAKLRRRSSMVHSGRISDTGNEVGYVTISTGLGQSSMFSSEEKKKRRQSMAYIQESSDALHSPETNSALEVDVLHIHDPHMLSFACYTTEMFRRQAKVVGAVCTYTFENKSPIIHPPMQQHDTQIQQVKLAEDGALKVYLRQQGGCRWLDLGRNWVCLPASPSGYLVTKAVPTWKNKVTFYYLHKHPGQYAVSRGVSNNNNNTNMSVSVNSSGAHSGCLYYENMHLHQSSGHSNCSHTGGPMQDDSDAFGGMQHASRIRSLDSELDAVAVEDMVIDSGCALPLPRALLTLQIESIPEEMTGEDELGFDEEEVATPYFRAEKSSAFIFSSFSLLSNICKFVAYERTGRSQGLLTLNKMWYLSSLYALSERIHSPTSSLAPFPASAVPRYPSSLFLNWTQFRNYLCQRPAGIFLSEGAAKRVYAVRAQGAGTLSALSVMDMEDMAAREMDACIAQELSISLVCSALRSLKICPNLLQIQKIFRSAYPIPADVYTDDLPYNQALKRSIRGEAENPLSSLASPKLVGKGAPRVPPMSQKGLFQYMELEFCRFGDLETYLRSSTIDARVLRALCFQMCYALYSVRERLGMLHQDVKLLNFFLTDGGDERGMRGSGTLRVGFGQHVYSLPSVPHAPCLVKLGDFGTSEVGGRGLGERVGAGQVTTIENLAPEVFLLGSCARRSFALDSFALGLAIMHLYTGK